MSALDELVRLLDQRTPGWLVHRDGRSWSAQDPDPEFDRWVSVTPGVPADRGPRLIGWASGIETRIQLPGMVDMTELRGVVEALTVLGVLLEVHCPTGIGNALGGYDCACGQPLTRGHEAWAVSAGCWHPGPIVRPAPNGTITA